MKILAVSCTQETLRERKNELAAAFPDAEIAAFVDPLLAAQYCSGRAMDLALCDYRLRIIDGIQLIKLLQRQNGSLIAALTESDGGHGSDARALGIGYFPQPVAPQTLCGFYAGAVRMREDAV